MAQHFDLEQMKEYLMSNDRVGVDIPIPEDLLTADGGRLILGKKLIQRTLSPVLRIFPWITTSDRIRESSFDPQELWEALDCFKQPLNDDQSDLFLSLLNAPSVVELLPMHSLGAVVALHKAYRDILQVSEEFGEGYLSDCNEHGRDDAQTWDGHVHPVVTDVISAIEIDSLDDNHLMSHGPIGTVPGSGAGTWVHSDVPIGDEEQDRMSESEDDLPTIGSDEDVTTVSGGECMRAYSLDDDDEWCVDRLYLHSRDASPPSPHLMSETSTVCESPADKDGPDLESRVDDLEGRVDNLEEGTTTMPGGKRIRSGRDRAAWMRIKRAHIHDRDKWCKPGAVMGVFPRGIGPLNGSASIHKILQVVVYSTDPDTIEEFPAGADRSEWAPIVMVRIFASV